MTYTMQDQKDPRIAATRQRALDAALELVAESGIQSCTFEAVSERSGVARSTLYRHWDNKSELVLDALKSKEQERIAPDTGNLRDDMLTSMLELGHYLKTWGALVPQLLAAASIDPDMSDIQKERSEYHLGIDVQVVERAIARGEIAEDTDAYHAALLFSAPIFYRHLYAREPVDAKWIRSHVDKTAALLQPTRP